MAAGVIVGRHRGALAPAGTHPPERILEREIARRHRPAVYVCDIDNFRAVSCGRLTLSDPRRP
jgi:hypothetical protein